MGNLFLCDISTPRPHRLQLSQYSVKQHSQTFIERLKPNLADCHMKKVIFNIKLTFIYMQISPSNPNPTPPQNISD